MVNSIWGISAHGIGCLVICRLIYEAASWVWNCFFRPAKDLKKFGEWAIVTGATDGIGRALALELAQRYGLKILLISRNQQRLEDTMCEVKKIYKGSDSNCCEILALDMCKLGEGQTDAIGKVQAKLKGKNIAVLYNNVGMSYDYPEYFDQVDDSLIGQLINLNVGATSYMTKLVVREMLAKESNFPDASLKMRGCIVNISSSLGCFDCPFYAGYCATKEFMNRFSNCCASDYSSKGIHFQVQNVCYVTSKLSKIRTPSLTTPTPENFAIASCKAIGWDHEISPYWTHYVLTGIVRWAPAVILQTAMKSTLGNMRARALKKKASVGKSE